MTNRTVLVSGHFNVLHPGHLRLLRFAKQYGGKLVVAVESDRIAGNASHVPEHLRLEGIQTNSWVDEAFIIDEPIALVIEKLRPDIVVKGKEHETIFNSELAPLESYGGKLLFSSGETIFSSIDLISKEFKEFDSKSIKLPLDFLSRHGIERKKLVKLVKDFSKLRVCVVGDVIVDEYITCEALGMSQEDPTIVVTPIDTTSFLGGAGIVAAHAAGLGAEVRFISVTGVDTTKIFVEKALADAGVATYLIEDDSRPTTLKQRFRCNGKSMLRVSYLHQDAISLDYQEQFLSKVENALDNSDLLVFSDFNYGCLPQSLVDSIIRKAKDRGLFIAADSQSSSQIGDISRFKGMDLITPTEREARISTRNHEDGLVVMAEKLRNQSSAKNIFIKLGGEGLLIHALSGKTNDPLTDRVNSLNSSPKDVAGAGDSLLITSALTLTGKGSILESACLGSLAAAVQVGRVGNTPIKAIELLKELL